MALAGGPVAEISKGRPLQPWPPGVTIEMPARRQSQMPQKTTLAKCPIVSTKVVIATVLKAWCKVPKMQPRTVHLFKHYVFVVV